jgi:hypothetical protein
MGQFQERNNEAYRNLTESKGKTSSKQGVSEFTC